MQSPLPPEQDPRLGAEPAEDGSASPQAGGPRTMTSSELLCGGRELRISHGDEVYRLLLTRTGKLLLQK